jgi:hypothetical protein
MSSTQRVAHNVFFKFKADITPAQIDHLTAELINLKKAIPGILSFSYGPNNSSEGFTQGYEYGFTMVFESVAARDAYLPHPAHQAVVHDVVLPLLEGAPFVFDWLLSDSNEFY